VFRTPTARTVRRTARDYYGWRDLRPGQLDAVQALVRGKDTLVVMPTGAGKSAVYQLAALLIDGPTVVISPLIALQRDQLAGLAARGEAGSAVAVNSAQRAKENSQAWESLRTGAAEFVFLAPEQLANEDVVDRLAAARVSLLVVDEAHCVSAWGHDFRPDYLRIADVLERLGRPTVVALTATASPPVRAEIVEKLRMRQPRQVIQGFDRPNLRLEVRRFTEAREKEDAVVEHVLDTSGSGLVYAATRKETERYAARLAEAGRSAAAYHAGLRADERDRVHAGFLDGSVSVVVATTAFGMGIDKPNVRFVVHADVSESLDAYYQEIGRAGRDGAPALALLCYRSEDLGLRAFYASGGADTDTLTLVATALRAAGGVEPAALRAELHLSHTRLTSAINLLEQAGAVTVEPSGELRYDRRRAVESVVDAAAGVAETHHRIDRSRVDMMRGYAETTSCRRQHLLGYFGEQLPDPCGNCDICTARAADRASTTTAAGRTTRNGRANRLGRAAKAEPAFPVNARVTHREWGPGVVMRPEPDRVTVLFDSVGYKTLALTAITADKDLLTLV
jgi:ATP-dependent DNA helicase RecQ